MTLYPLTRKCSFCFASAEYEPFERVLMCDYHFKTMVNGDLDKLSPHEKANRMRRFMEVNF